MANPIPCAACGDGSPGHLLVTDQTDDFSVMGQPTISLCVPHMAEVLFNKIQALQDALEAEPEAEPQPAPADSTPPGVLEQIEGVEGPVSPAPLPSRPKSKKAPPAPDNGTEAAPEAETADVNR